MAGVVEERQLHVLLRFWNLHSAPVHPVQRWPVVVRHAGQWVHPHRDYGAGTNLVRVYGDWSGWTGCAGSKEAKAAVVRGEPLRNPQPGIKTTLNKGFLALYHASLDNATDLFAESEILFDTEKYARAYALALAALEEMYKSQLAADVFTGLITEEEFQECSRDQRKRTDRMVWAPEDAKHYLAMPEEDCMAVQEPTFVGRIDAMYVRFQGEKVVPPSDSIGRDAARGIIHTAQVAIQHIIEMTEFWGYQIGTKGFIEGRVAIDQGFNPAHRMPANLVRSFVRTNADQLPTVYEIHMSGGE